MIRKREFTVFLLFRKTGNGNDPEWAIVEKDKFIHELDTDKNMKLEGKYAC